MLIYQEILVYFGEKLVLRDLVCVFVFESWVSGMILYYAAS